MPHLVPNTILIPEIASILRQKKQVQFTPTGVSMRPYIEGGRDTVVLEKKDIVKVGDVCLVDLHHPKGNEPTCYVLHRVIRLGEPMSDGEREIILMGDGNLRGRELCRETDVLGTVVSIASPTGRRKPLTNGWLWRQLLPIRWLLLKVYRHSILKWCY